MITVENGLFLLLQAFSSGVAGYITNKYAVNMIFKEYRYVSICRGISDDTAQAYS